MTTKTRSLPYNHDYPVSVSIGLVGEQADSINPATESSYSEEEWDSLTREQQEEWLNAETYQWAMQFLDYGWRE